MKSQSNSKTPFRYFTVNGGPEIKSAISKTENFY